MNNYYRYSRLITHERTSYSIFHLYEVHLNPSPALPAVAHGGNPQDRAALRKRGGCALERGWGVLHLLAIRCIMGKEHHRDYR